MVIIIIIIIVTVRMVYIAVAKAVRPEEQAVSQWNLY